MEVDAASDRLVDEDVHRRAQPRLLLDHGAGVVDHDQDVRRAIALLDEAVDREAVALQLPEQGHHQRP